ncbi:MAG: ThiF family adenylyltransferase [Myxococcota bacterium]
MTTRIALIGAGALGSHVALLTRNLDVVLKAVDFDRIEQKNTLSQFHTRMSLGHNKAKALKQTMMGLFGTRIEAVPHRLTVDNVDALLSDSDLILDCLDNGASRRIVQTWARAHNTPCLHGALAPDGTYGRIVWDEHFAIDDEPQHAQATCEDGEHLPFIVLVAAVMAQSVQTFLTRDGLKQSFHLHAGGVVQVT